MRFQRSRSFAHGLVVELVLLVIFLAGATTANSQSTDTTASTPATQETFATPQLAANALIQAADANDVPALIELFGPDGKDLISSADPVQDKQRIQEFVAKGHEKMAVLTDPNNKARAILTAGNDDWPFPVPIVKQAGKWRFDAKAGREEILYRRVGSNELDAIQICRGFVEAQKEYASEIHDDSGINQYAQRIISTPGKQDGLYWKNDDGSPGGPITEAVARAIEEGYSPDQPSGYHGYYFKVLKGQGPAARLGQLDYVINEVMIGGFALVAVPAEYRATGVKTFMVSYDGVVYEKDLGPDSLKIVQSMERYNPDKTWHPTQELITDEPSESE